MHLLTSAAVAERETYKCHVALTSNVIGEGPSYDSRRQAAAFARGTNGTQSNTELIHSLALGRVWSTER